MSITFTHLTGPKKGRRETFGSERISIGRAQNNSLRFGDHERRVSAHHAEIRNKDGVYLLRDLGSTNGTMINGRRIIVSEINDDDMIEIGAGGPLLRFNLEPDETDAVAPEVAGREPSLIEPRSDSRAGSRAGNSPLILALAVALLLGAAGGIWLYSRAGGQGPGSMSFAELAERSGPAVVFIRAEFEIVDAAGQVISSYSRSGSGFVISPGSRIITNRHLVRDWEYNPPPAGASGRTARIEVILPGHRREETMAARIHQLSHAPETDVAILEVSQSHQARLPDGIPPASEPVGQGEDVAVIGYPLGLDLLKLTREDRIANSFTTGVVSRVNDGVIQLSLRAYRGNSGGPALNRKGEAIGILTANVEYAQDITLCTPIAEVMRIMDGALSRSGGW